MEVVPIGGLCNRLRVIGSRLAAARAAGKTLTAWWIVGRDCPARFRDLFHEPPVDMIIHENVAWPAHVERTCSVLAGSNENEWAPVAMDALKPLPAIQARIDALLARLGPEFSAVHIRRTDHNARYEEDTVYTDFATGSDRPCFCAADNPRSIATLKRTLGERLVYGGAFKMTGIRMTELADAVTDLWVASYAVRFRGTYWSSFSDWIDMMRRWRGLPAGDLSKITDAK